MLKRILNSIDHALGIICTLIAAICTAIAIAFLSALGVVASLALPALCIVAIWGIFKYFGVV